MTPTASLAAANWHIASLDSPVDGMPIRFAFLRPKPKAKRAVLFLNGRSEWIEKYFDLPELFDLGEDTMWVTLDHRGQGGSGGPRAYVESYADFAADAAAVLEAVAEDLPYGILSHSMGGLVAMHGTLSGILQPKVMALSSPLFALNSPLPMAIARPLMRFMASTYHSQQPSMFGSLKEEFANNPLTSSISGFNVVRESPYPYVPPTFGWIHATIKACGEILDPIALRELKAPVRVLGGSVEHVIDPAGWSRWCQAASQETKVPIEFRRVNRGRHELLNEIPRIRSQSVELLKGWLSRHLSSQDPE